MFVATVIGYLTSDAMVTLGMCILGCFAVGVIMRFFVKQALRGLDDYMAGEGIDPYKKAVYSGIKGSLYTIIGAGLTLFVLVQLMSHCVFPCDNAKCFAWIYFVAMYLAQRFFDAHLVELANRFLGINITIKEREPRAKRERKPRVKYKKVKYVLDDNGNEIVVQ